MHVCTSVTSAVIPALSFPAINRKLRSAQMFEFCRLRLRRRTKVRRAHLRQHAQRVERMEVGLVDALDVGVGYHNVRQELEVHQPPRQPLRQLATMHRRKCGQVDRATYGTMFLRRQSSATARCCDLRTSTQSPRSQQQETYLTLRVSCTCQDQCRVVQRLTAKLQHLAQRQHLYRLQRVLHMGGQQTGERVVDKPA